MHQARAPFLFALILGFAASAHAQNSPSYPFDPLDIQKKSAHLMGGLVGFAALECKVHSSTQIAALKQEQKQKSIAGGLPGEEFEAEYARGHAEASRNWAAMSAPQRSQACAKAQAVLTRGP